MRAEAANHAAAGAAKEATRAEAVIRVAVRAEKEVVRAEAKAAECGHRVVGGKIAIFVETNHMFTCRFFAIFPSQK